MSKAQETTISVSEPSTAPSSAPSTAPSTEPSTPVEASHHLRPSLTERDNVLYASYQADSTAPEGGRGWIVVFACSLISFWSVGTVYSWGVMQAALLKGGLSSPATLSWIGSLTFACTALLALVNARAIRRFGARDVALFGVSVLALGDVLSGFCTKNVGGLFATAGLTSGIGVRYDKQVFPPSSLRTNSGVCPSLCFLVTQAHSQSLDNRLHL